MSNESAKQTSQPEQQIPQIFRAALESISGGRVLDVATGVGNFVHFLRAGLKDYESIIGIDTMDGAVDHARKAFEDDRVSFRTMDACQMIFEDDTFDTVSIMASIHHFEHLDAVMQEVRRVLRPGGTLIVAEMHGDGPSDAARTGIELHRWAAEVDSAAGQFHGQTLSRDALLELIRGWDWSSVEIREWAEEKAQPMEEAALEQLDGMIQKFVERARTAGADDSICDRGEDLRTRIRTIGLGQQPFVIAVGVLG